MERRVHGANEMAAFARDFVAALARRASAATVIALSGELGAGKTAFTQGAAAALGVAGVVASPTFVIQKVYELQGQRWRKLIHIDAYRLKNEDELRGLGWSELVADPGNLIIIEWPDNVPDAIPDDSSRVSIEMNEGSERTIHYGD